MNLISRSLRQNIFSLLCANCVFEQHATVDDHASKFLDNVDQENGRFPGVVGTE
jgi:hypothetical protein